MSREILRLRAHMLTKVKLNNDITYSDVQHF